MLPDEQFADDEHVYCPTCAVRERWVGRVLAVYEAIKVGIPFAAVAPEPTDALIAGLALVAREVESRNAQQREDRRPA